MRFATDLTAERARELFSYDPDTGVVTRRVSNRYARWKGRAGSVFGSVNCDGYLVGQIDGQKYLLHRVVWLMQTGEWPKEEIDHRNTVRTDNRFANLREATRAQNSRNTKDRPSACPLKGAYWDRRRSKWYAQITTGGQHYSLGAYDTPEAAHAAYVEAAEKFYGNFARAA